MTNSVEGCRASNMKKLFMDISGNHALHFQEPASLFRSERNSKTSAESSENETPTLRVSCKGLSNASGDW